MYTYHILINGQLKASYEAKDEDMRFALAEWLHESDYELEEGTFVKTEDGYSLQIEANTFEIQPFEESTPGIVQ